MFSRTFKLVASSLLLAAPAANAQFGVAGNRRAKGGDGAASFEELNKLASDRMKAGGMEVGGGAGGGLDDMIAGLSEGLGGMDLGALMQGLDSDTLGALVKEGLQDPEIQKMFAGMEGALDELTKMDSNELMAQMQDAMEMLTSVDMQDSIMQNKEEVLQMMEAQGTATPEEIAEYRQDPEKFSAAMTDAFGQMKEVFSDPEAMEQMMGMVKGFGSVLQDPQAAMSKLGDVLQDALSDDDAIEAARQQLLTDPAMGGNRAVNDLFKSPEMIEVLKDPVKWRNSVKEGQKMLTGMGEQDGNKIGVGMGEL